MALKGFSTKRYGLLLKIAQLFSLENTRGTLHFPQA